MESCNSSKMSKFCKSKKMKNLSLFKGEFTNCRQCKFYKQQMHTQWLQCNVIAQFILKDILHKCGFLVALRSYIVLCRCDNVEHNFHEISYNILVHQLRQILFHPPLQVEMLHVFSLCMTVVDDFFSPACLRHTHVKPHILLSEKKNKKQTRHVLSRMADPVQFKFGTSI